MSSVSKRRREGPRAKIKSMGDHKEFLKRITKTLSYGQLPPLPCLSLPVTELSCELWSVSQRGRSLRRLHADAAAEVARQACVSPCALVLAILYLERLKTCNPDYLAATPPVDLFLVSLMVGNKFLQDDGEDDEVICSEWAASGGLELGQLKKLEVEFLNAIEWKVFVSDASFEAGLRWLERQVGARQGRARGFFTYSELAAWGERALLAALGPAALACAAALAALLACALLAAHCLTPPPPRPATPLTPLAAPPISSPLSNCTAELPALAPVPGEPLPLVGRLECCAQWLRHRRSTADSYRHESATARRPPSLDSWWPNTAVLDWLYRSSLVDPLQRWLEMINEYTEFLKRHSTNVELLKPVERCNEYTKAGDPQYCIRQKLNLSKLSALLVSMSDR